MFQTLHNISESIRRFLNRTEYVFKIFVWAVDTLRTVSDCLGKFPRPDTGSAATGDGNEGAGKPDAGANASASGDTVPGAPEQLDGDIKDGNGGLGVVSVQDGKQSVGNASIDGTKP